MPANRRCAVCGLHTFCRHVKTDVAGHCNLVCCAVVQVKKPLLLVAKPAGGAGKQKPHEIPLYELMMLWTPVQVKYFQKWFAVQQAAQAKRQSHLHSLSICHATILPTLLQVKEFQKWFAGQQAAQAKCKPHEEPAYKSADAGSRLDELRKAFAKLKNRKKVHQNRQDTGCPAALPPARMQLVNLLQNLLALQNVILCAFVAVASRCYAACCCMRSPSRRRRRQQRPATAPPTARPTRRPAVTRRALQGGTAGPAVPSLRTRRRGM